VTARTLTSIGAGAAVLAATLQALAVADPFPNWTTDPWVTFTPGVGFGPCRLDLEVPAQRVAKGPRVGGAGFRLWQAVVRWVSIPLTLVVLVAGLI